MARRSDHSREELYELAMQAAENIVERDGFRALTARNVADAIGYSPGTLYNLFANLDEMIVHLNGRTLDKLRDRLDAIAATGAPDRDLRRLLDGYLAFLADHPNLWKTLFEYSLPEGGSLPEWYVRKVGRVMGVVEAALAPLFGDGDGDGDGGAAEDAARVLWASLHGICTLSDAGKLQVVATQNVRHMAENLIANYIAGLAAGREGHAL